MAITELNARSDASIASTKQASKAKIVFVSLLFLLSLVSFLCQTEFTSQAYKYGFKEPIILLLVTHGSWWLLWPLQAFFVLIGRTIGKAKNRRGKRYERLNSNAFLLENEAGHPQEGHQQSMNSFHAWGYFKRCLIKQVLNVYHTLILVYEPNVNGDKSTSNLSALVERNPQLPSSGSFWRCLRMLVATPAFRYVFVKAGLISLVLNTAGITWYGAMALTYASDVTAIYNCSAFTAYAFAIPLLNERFSWLKASSVVIAVAGVFIVAYSGSTGSDANRDYPYRFWGNLVISVGAVMYGYYEVLYKKYTCIPAHLSSVVTPRRQSTFANFVMGLLGLFTVALLLIGIFLAEITHLYHFNLFDYGDHTSKIWLFISGSIVSNLLFSASFLSLMALTSPVLSSVSSLVTIFLIGVVEWVLFGNALGVKQLIGDALVIVGFVVLTIASWKEISEGSEDDEIDEASLYSFATNEHN